MIAQDNIWEWLFLPNTILLMIACALKLSDIYLISLILQSYKKPSHCFTVPEWLGSKGWHCILTTNPKY